MLIDTFSLSWTIRNDHAELSALIEDAESSLSSRGVSLGLIHHVILSLEELVTNTIKYGYPEGGVHDVSVSVSTRAGELLLDVVDGGKEFDPTGVIASHVMDDISDRPIGGLGIHLIRNLSNRFEYKRENGNNHIRVGFNLNPD